MRSGGVERRPIAPPWLLPGLGGGHYAVNCAGRIAQRALLRAARRRGEPRGLLLLLLLLVMRSWRRRRRRGCWAVGPLMLLQLLLL